MEEREEERKVIEFVTPERELVSYLEIKDTMNTIICLIGGKLHMNDCILSLNFLYSQYKGILQAVVAGPNTYLNMNKCEILGNSSV